MQFCPPTCVALRDPGSTSLSIAVFVRLALVLLGVCLCASARAEPERVARFALVLGNNRARGVESLRYADDDALGMQQLFLDANIESRLLVSFDPATRELHPRATADGAATLENFEREMAAVEARIRASAARGLSTEFYFFFSGHGDVEAGEGRLILEDHALTRADLYELLASSGASVNHVFLDACSSFLVASKRADVQRRQPVDPAFALRQTPDQLGNVGFVLSSSSDRESHEWERFEAGIVSHELRSGLRGAADANLDGRISYAELAAFMHQANRAIDIPRLRPDPFLLPPGKKDWDQPVFSWQSGTVSVRVQGAAGHFYVENMRGERLLDAHPTPAQRLYLHLPSERPLFLRGHERSAEYELSSATPADVSELTEVAGSLRGAKGAEQFALNQLFATPFGSGDVLDYEHRLSSAAQDAPGVPLDSGRSPWIRPLGYAALTVTVVGVGLTTAALVTYLDARGGSQLEAQRSNQRIERYHELSLIPYAAAATTAILWGWLTLASDDTSTGMRWSPSLAKGQLLLRLDASF